VPRKITKNYGGEGGVELPNIRGLQFSNATLIAPLIKIKGRSSDSPSGPININYSSVCVSQIWARHFCSLFGDGVMKRANQNKCAFFLDFTNCLEFRIANVAWRFEPSCFSGHHHKPAGRARFAIIDGGRYRLWILPPEQNLSSRTVVSFSSRYLVPKTSELLNLILTISMISIFSRAQECLVKPVDVVISRDFIWIVFPLESRLLESTFFRKHTYVRLVDELKVFSALFSGSWDW